MTLSSITTSPICSHLGPYWSIVTSSSDALVLRLCVVCPLLASSAHCPRSSLPSNRWWRSHVVHCIAVSRFVPWFGFPKFEMVHFIHKWPQLDPFCRCFVFCCFSFGFFSIFAMIDAVYKLIECPCLYWMSWTVPHCLCANISCVCVCGWWALMEFVSIYF